MNSTGSKREGAPSASLKEAVMTTYGLKVFDDTIHTTNVWLKDLVERLPEGAERDDAYRALRGTLHALRDRMPVNSAAAFAAQLPMLIRSFYYEGWRPAETPSADRSQDDFIGHVTAAFERSETVDAEAAVRAVLALLNDKISAGEIDHVKKTLPAEIRELWPEPAEA
jgi:uncharacterized protein (DUF2267 family)